MVVQAFESAFDEVIETVKKILDDHERRTLASELAFAEGSGTQNFEFALDGAGGALYQFSKYGAGVTVNCEAWIIDPDDVYDLAVSSSDGGGGSWNGLRVNQKIVFPLNTSIWKPTNFAVLVKARNSKNVGGKGVLNYSY
ncbi:hypothetical protein [Methylocystis sp. SB2]|uniref:hypothetical protein n=1 Tax=Methylocystis sp. (strain SB2) TaxID=743836 RepID=UPI0003F73275|nr:hypothetical protein [Methylocystis sp. SB2]ULO25076.1 hypothetical protein LNB28_06725 [Methylocystis sp. SB2]